MGPSRIYAPKEEKLYEFENYEQGFKKNLEMNSIFSVISEQFFMPKEWPWSVLNPGDDDLVFMGSW